MAGLQKTDGFRTGRDYDLGDEFPVTLLRKQRLDTVGLRADAINECDVLARGVAVKEQRAETVKHEVAVIWADYFKPEHLTAFPDLHTKVWDLLKLAGKNKQGVDAQAAADLEAATKEFADMFWATKK